MVFDTSIESTRPNKGCPVSIEKKRGKRDDGWQRILSDAVESCDHHPRTLDTDCNMMLGEKFSTWKQFFFIYNLLLLICLSEIWMPKQSSFIIQFFVLCVNSKIQFADIHFASCRCFSW